MHDIEKTNRKKMASGKPMKEKVVIKERMEKAKIMADFRGEYFDLKKRNNEVKNQMKEQADYRGDIRAFKVEKEMHPSVYYRVGLQKRTPRAKEFGSPANRSNSSLVSSSWISFLSQR